MNLLPESWRSHVESLRDQIQDGLARWIPRLRKGGHRTSDAGFPGRIFTAGPAIDVEETPEEIVVRAEMPGLEKGDFSVDAASDMLYLRGEKRHHRESRKRNAHQIEHAYGRFLRAVPLPCEVQAERAAAQYRQGVLTVRLPKSETARRRHIQIHMN